MGIMGRHHPNSKDTTEAPNFYNEGETCGHTESCPYTIFSKADSLGGKSDEKIERERSFARTTQREASESDKTIRRFLQAFSFIQPPRSPVFGEMGRS